MERHRPLKIVLTGGPCAGKTTSIKRILESLPKIGFRMYVVPEAATMFFCHGNSLGDLGNDEFKLVFQTQLLRTQLFLEDTFCKLAEACPEKSVVLCDRGAMDGQAYMSREMWVQMLSENGWNEDRLRDDRYDAVMHLVTAADGADSFYSFDNNHIRSETKDEAIDLDRRLRGCWAKHKHMHVFDNSTDFDGKINRLVQTFLEIVDRGFTTPLPTLPKEIAPAPSTLLTSSPAPDRENNTLFVGNLSFYITDSDMHDFFSAAGPVTSCRIVMDRDDLARSRGFGYVEFAESSSAAKALAELNGVELGGRAVRLDLSSSSRGSGSGRGDRGDRGGSRGWFRGARGGDRGGFRF